MFNAQRFDYTGIAATGVVTGPNGQSKIALPDGARSFAVQVSIPSGAITSWDVRLQGSMDGVNWTDLVTHNANIGSTQWAVDKPVAFLRVNVAALALNTAPSIAVSVLAEP